MLDEHGLPFCELCLSFHDLPKCTRPAFAHLFAPPWGEDPRQNHLSEELLGLKCPHGVAGPCHLCKNQPGNAPVRPSLLRP